MQPDAFATLLANGDRLAEHLAGGVTKRPTLADMREREAEDRGIWERHTEDRARAIPEPFRDGFRLGRWMQWAGKMLHLRASWAAAETGRARPDPGAWERGYRLLDLAEVMMGAARRWQDRMEALGALNDPLDVGAALPIDRRSLTMERLAEAIIANGLLPFTVRMTPAELRAGTIVAQALETTGRHHLAGVLRRVLGVYVTRAELARTVPAGAIVVPPESIDAAVRAHSAEAEHLLDRLCQKEPL